MPAGGRRVTVYVADDHPVYRDGVVLALRARPAEFQVVGTGADGRIALAALRQLRCDVAVLDVRMPGLDGMAVLRSLREEALPTSVVLVSATFDAAHARAALDAGASALLSKESTRERICEAIAAAARGERVAAPEADGHGFRPLLSARELEVLHLTAAGLSAPAIGRELHLSPETIKTHLRNVYDKLGVSDRAAAVAEGMRRGLLE
jgi:two-component system nitrate/nitrite response regulator NarL